MNYLIIVVFFERWIKLLEKSFKGRYLRTSWEEYFLSTLFRILFHKTKSQRPYNFASKVNNEKGKRLLGLNDILKRYHYRNNEVHDFFLPSVYTTFSQGHWTLHFQKSFKCDHFLFIFGLVYHTAYFAQNATLSCWQAKN